MIENVAANGGHVAAGVARWDRWPRWPARVVAIVVVAAAVGGIGGYALRDRASTVTVRVGKAVSTPYQIGIAIRGWSFLDIPLHVPWRDVGGTWHFGDRPACLPPTGAIPDVTVGTVNATGGGGPSYPLVVWVDCGAAR